MTRHAQFLGRKIAEKALRDPEPEKVASGLSPLRESPVAMSSVGTGRLTRVFVPNSNSMVEPDDGLAARVLRSGKRLTLEPATKRTFSDRDGNGDTSGWVRPFGSAIAAEQPIPLNDDSGEEGRRKKQRNSRAADEFKPEGKLLEEKPSNSILKDDSGISSLHAKAFGIVYFRKRRRSKPYRVDQSFSWKGTKQLEDGLSLRSDESLSSSTVGEYVSGHRFGVVFSRKPHKKPKLSSVLESTDFESSEKQLGTSAEAVYNFAETVGILQNDLWFGSVGHIVLVVLIRSTTNSSCYRFTCFLVSILTWMMKKKVSLFGCAAFVSSKSLARVFNSHGIHFLPVRHWKSDFSRKNAISDAGICILFGARLLIPLVTVNFSVLPIFFKSLHLSISLSSLFLPTLLARFQRKTFIDGHMEVSFEERRLYILYGYLEASTFEMEVISLRSAAAPDVEQAYQILPANTVNSVAGVSTGNITRISDVKFQKKQRKRGSPRSSRATTSQSKRRKKGLSDRRGSKSKVNTRNIVEHCHGEGVGDCSGKVSTEERVTPSSMSYYKTRNSVKKSSIQRLKKVKIAFAEAKNIDKLSCTANVLVTESDRCWRDDGAKVMLEISSSSQWCLAVKSGNTTRYLHKVQEEKPSVTNEYTNAVIWTGVTGWKLEFCGKKEWNVFKELQRECSQRNLQELPVRMIPVPGVQHVPGYEESFSPLFVRPHPYIHTVSEVERALMSETVCYDMDSSDEEWLKQLNLESSTGDAHSFIPITDETFEKILSALEKAAYIHDIDDLSELERSTSLCSTLGSSDMVATVFDYWLKKRKQKRYALVRIFQAQPSRKIQEIQKPLLRKRRSIKRQGSHARREKTEIFLEGTADQYAMRKFQEAEASASRAVDIAVRLRIRAQVLMMNADLAAYKSVMALRLAETFEESGPPDLPHFSVD